MARPLHGMDLLSRTGSANTLIDQHMPRLMAASVPGHDPRPVMTGRRAGHLDQHMPRLMADSVPDRDDAHRCSARFAQCTAWLRNVARGPGQLPLFRSWRRATAAVEFALTTPLLVILLAGAADYGVAQFSRANLANAVAAGCQYAYLTGTTVTAANIQAVISNAMFLPAGASANLSIAITGPKGYCVTGSGPTMSSSTPGSVCTVDGSIAGTYVIISATYTTSGLMNGFLSSATQAMTESATVRLN